MFESVFNTLIRQINENENYFESPCHSSWKGCYREAGDTDAGEDTEPQSSLVGM